MAKAKTKEGVVNILDLSADERVKICVQKINDVQQETKIGLKLVLRYMEDGVKPDLAFVDLTAKETPDAETPTSANATPVSAEA